MNFKGLKWSNYIKKTYVTPIMLVIFMSLMVILIILNFKYFFLSKTPMVVSIHLMMMSLWMGLILWEFVSKWFGITLILLFAGGMMISFLYVSCLSLNHKISYKKNSLVSTILFFSLVTSFNYFYFNNSFSLTPKMFFMAYNCHVFIFLIIYLIVVMFFSVKISQNFKGSLTQKF